MSQILGVEVVNDILNLKVSDEEKVNYLNDKGKKVLSYKLLNTDSSIVTLGESILEKDPDTKTMIFESGKKEVVLKMVLSKYTKGEQIILQGHSAGGGDVQDLAEKLRDAGVSNIVTIQIDSVEPIGDDASIPSNVTKAINVYETKAPFYITGENEIYPDQVDSLFSVLTGSKIPEVVNKKFNDIINATDKNPISYHTEIDNDPKVRKFIKKEVIDEVIKDLSKKH